MSAHDKRFMKRAYLLMALLVAVAIVGLIYQDGLVATLLNMAPAVVLAIAICLFLRPWKNDRCVSRRTSPAAPL